MGVCWIGLSEDLCCCGTEQEILYINPGAEFTTGTDSSVGRALVMIADDAGSIPAQSNIFSMHSKMLDIVIGHVMCR